MSDRAIVKVKTEKTPNPNTLKYKFSRVLLPKGVAEYENKEDAVKSSPLAFRVFKVIGVQKVFIGTNFISITKNENVSWEEVNAELAVQLEDFFESGELAVINLESSINLEDLKNMSQEDKEIVKQIENILNDKVRPALMADGGNIELVGYKDKIVYVKLMGACHGCPSAGATLKQGVEKTLKFYLEDTIKEVIQV